MRNFLFCLGIFFGSAFSEWGLLYFWGSRISKMDSALAPLVMVAVLGSWMLIGFIPARFISSITFRQEALAITTFSFGGWWTLVWLADFNFEASLVTFPLSITILMLGGQIFAMVTKGYFSK